MPLFIPLMFHNTYLFIFLFMIETRESNLGHGLRHEKLLLRRFFVYIYFCILSRIIDSEIWLSALSWLFIDCAQSKSNA